jgi:hypothetical protein
MALELELRAATATDLPYLSTLAADPSVEPFLSPGAGTEERLAAILSQAESDGEFGGMFVIASDAGESLGGLALELVSRHSRICELTRLITGSWLRSSATIGGVADRARGRWVGWWAWGATADRTAGYLGMAGGRVNVTGVHRAAMGAMNARAPRASVPGIRAGQRRSEDAAG